MPTKEFIYQLLLWPGIILGIILGYVISIISLAGMALGAVGFVKYFVFAIIMQSESDAMTAILSIVLFIVSFGLLALLLSIDESICDRVNERQYDD